MVKSSVLIKLVGMLLCGCSTPKKPSWYKSQGWLDITNCGPAAAAMVVEYSTGTPDTIAHARAFNTSAGTWWHLEDIQRYTEQQGAAVRLIDYVGELPDGLAVYHVDNVHFVVAMPVNKTQVRVFDPNPMVSSQVQLIQRFMRRVTYDQIITFKKQGKQNVR